MIRSGESHSPKVCVPLNVFRRTVRNIPHFSLFVVAHCNPVVARSHFQFRANVRSFVFHLVICVSSRLACILNNYLNFVLMSLISFKLPSSHEDTVALPDCSSTVSARVRGRLRAIFPICRDMGLAGELQLYEAYSPP